MKYRFHILISILILTFGKVYAHRDFWVVNNFGNVKVRVETGYDYEEINKAFIIGKLAEELSTQLNFSDSIFLDFNHYYVDDCNPDYFISFDKGRIDDLSNNLKEKDYLNTNSIVIRQVSKTFDIQATLKLLEYSIKNIEKLKTTQKKIKYKKNYCNWKIKTIDTTTINKQLKFGNSEVMMKILSKRIDRPEKDLVSGISYYWQNNQFHVIWKEDEKSDVILMSLKNIYQFSRPSNNLNAFIFNSDSSFYFIDSSKIVSRLHTISGIKNCFAPYELGYIGGDKYSICFRYYSYDDGPQPSKEKIIYQSTRDILTESE
jgi:hypothetical protein